MENYEILKKGALHLNSSIDEELNYSIEFDDERISFFVDNREVAFSWEDYNY
ncbi:MAG: hypothetical protein ABJA32_03645 [Ginsengibacter sp.]|jgi:hypothetical protein